MADTARGDFPEEVCSDCGRKGCSFITFSEVVPKGETGKFCGVCWMARNVNFDETGTALPLGNKWRLVSEEFADKEITVKTESGSVYVFGKPLAETNFLVTPAQKKLGLFRKVHRENKELPFTRAEIILLRIGKSMCLNYYGNEASGTDETFWGTTPVVCVEYTENAVIVTTTRPKELREAMQKLK